MIKKIETFLSVLLVCMLAWLIFDLRRNIIRQEQEPETEAVSQTQKENAPPEILPVAYDAREHGKAPQVKDQGMLGTCWALAASSALEAYFLPGQNIVFSADHISMQNSFDKTQNDGGDYTMVMAYLSGWQGPVAEEDDPYGDGVSDGSLTPVKHVQEMQMIKDKDYDAVKRAVCRYGAVQSSIYMDLKNAFSSSVYYNRIESSYLYDGAEKANHDILIIGWDDNYTASRFNRTTTKNGAFICQNSWGEKFGENGIFYVSYQDINIGKNCIVYTDIEDTDNYDHIYQSDSCGWVGQLGYGDSECFCANVYEAGGPQTLEAVGMYAVGKNTEYQIYLVDQFENTGSFLKKRLLKEGRLEQIGYYTIALDEKTPLEKGQRYAVMVQIRTPGEQYPVATEYAADEATKTVDISDGEGYISHNGFVWTRTEEEHRCNVCLKAYTRDR